METINEYEGLDILNIYKNEHADYVEIVEELGCGKLKWLPTHIQRREFLRKKEGFLPVDENPRRIRELPGLLYQVVLVFRKYN